MATKVEPIKIRFIMCCAPTELRSFVGFLWATKVASLWDCASIGMTNHLSQSFSSQLDAFAVN